MRRSLSKLEIVRSQNDIDRIFKNGRSFSCHGLRIIAVANSLDCSRIIVIPVKHYGNSVERNHIRRQYKEIYRTSKSDIRTGFDFAFIVYKGKTASYEEKKAHLISLLDQAGFHQA